MSQQEWDKKWEELEQDFDNFRLYFDKNRKCKCPSVDECSHFDKAIQIFDKQLNKLDKINKKLFGKFVTNWYDITEQINCSSVGEKC